MSRKTAVNDTTIFRRHQDRFLSKSRLSKSRREVVNVSSTKKKENKQFSCSSLTAEIKNVLRLRIDVNLDSNREYRQKTSEATRLAVKSKKLFIDSDKNRENKFDRFSFQTKSSQDVVD
jgi:hypothetical protein